MIPVLDGSIELDPDLFELRRNGDGVPLAPQAIDGLVHLVEHRDRVVPKEELMDAVRGGRVVSETAVTSRIKQVRRALGDDGHSQRIVRTVHARGYRFVADVREAEDVPPAPPPARPGPASRLPGRYTTSDGLHIAYQVTCGGDCAIVLSWGSFRPPTRVIPPTMGHRHRCVLAPHMQAVRSIRVGRKISPAAQGCWGKCEQGVPAP